MVFLVLCLTTFAILSLSSAQSDYSFSKKFAEHKTEYYKASSRAEMILGEIDQLLAENSDQVTARLDGKEIDNIPLSCTGADGETVISYQVPSGEKQALNVVLLVTNDSEHENYYKIQAWQLISTEEWNGDNSLNLIPVE